MQYYLTELNLLLLERTAIRFCIIIKIESQAKTERDSYNYMTQKL